MGTPQVCPLISQGKETPIMCLEEDCSFYLKSYKACSMYVMDRGMFSDAEVQTLKHLMNGVIEFKTEDLKNFMRVEGIGDVRTRGWIEFSHTTNSITLIGSFAVDHIR